MAVVFGGPSLEHKISLLSGRQVLANLDPARYRSVPVLIEPHGAWVVDGVLRGGALEGAAAMIEAGCAAAFLALHGPFGEDGTIQGFLETIGMPYVGSGVAGSAIARDKIRAKRLLAAYGILGAPDLTVPTASAADVRRKLGFPAVVKNPCQGSTLGLRIARDEAQFEAAVAELGSGCDSLLVERCERGREFTVSVLLGQPLPVVEIVAPGGFFDFEAKYRAGGAEEIVPARIEEPVACAMQELGLRAHEILGLGDMSRTDLILKRSGEIVFLETNSIPGLTSHSLLPKAAAAAGIPFCEMLTRLLEACLPATVSPAV